MSSARFSYHKLKQHDHHQVSESVVQTALKAAKRLIRASVPWRVPVRRRLRVRRFGMIIRVRSYLRSRKVKLVKKIKGSWKKVVKRVRESQVHFGDLFAGNYLLLQVNPTPLKGGGGGGGRLGFVEDSRNPMYNCMTKITTS